MASTDSNTGYLHYEAESSWGVIPGGTLTRVMFVSEDLDPFKEVVESEILHTHRASGQVLKTGIGARGNIQTEMSFGTYNAWIASALAGFYSTVAESITVTVSGQTLTRASGSFSSTQQGARYVKIASAATSSNNGIKKVASWSSGSVTLEAGSLSGSDAGDVITLTTSYVRNSNYKTSYSFQRTYTGLGVTHYLLWSGMMVNSWNLSLNSKSKIISDWGFVGKEPTSTSFPGGSYDTDNVTTDILTANTNVGTVYEGGSALALGLKSLTASISQNLRLRPLVGSDTGLQPELGRLTASGTLQAYFSSSALLDTFLSHTDTSIEFALSGSQLLNVYFPVVKLLEGNPNISGRSTDIVQRVPFVAIPNSSGTVIQVDLLS